jgi:cytoskeletal protein CcmA (bactofilin family)
LLKKGTTINGDLKSEGDARIDGIVNGNIDIKGKVVIGSSGKITGDINCAFCDIEGEVKGKLSINNTLTLKTTAKYTGEITTNKLIIEPGALFNGSCKMDQKSYGNTGSVNEKKL